MKRTSLRILSLVTAFIMTFSSMNVSAYAGEMSIGEYVTSEESTDVDYTLSDEKISEEVSELNSSDEVAGEITAEEASEEITEGETSGEMDTEASLEEMTTESEDETDLMTEEESANELPLADSEDGVRVVDRDMTSNAVTLIQSKYYKNADGKYDIFFYVGYPSVTLDKDLYLIFAGASFGNSNEVKYADQYSASIIDGTICNSLNFTMKEFVIHDVELNQGSVDYKFYLYSWDESLADKVDGYIKGTFTAENDVIDYRCVETDAIVVYCEEYSTIYPRVTMELEYDDYVDRSMVLIDSEGKRFEVKGDYYVSQSWRGAMDVSDSRYNYSFEYNSSTYTFNDSRSKCDFKMHIEIPFNELPEGKYDIEAVSKNGKKCTIKNAVEIAKGKTVVWDVVTPNPGPYNCDTYGDYMPVEVRGVNIPDNLRPEFFDSKEASNNNRIAVFDEEKCYKSIDLGNRRIYIVRKKDEIKGPSTGDLYFKFALNSENASEVIYTGDNAIVDSNNVMSCIKGSFCFKEITGVILEKGTTKRLRLYFAKEAFEGNPVGDVVEVLSTKDVYDYSEDITASYIAPIQIDEKGRYFAVVPGSSQVYQNLLKDGTGTVGYGNSALGIHTSTDWMMRFTVSEKDYAMTVSNLTVPSGEWVLRYPDMRTIASGTAGVNLLSNSDVLRCSEETHMVLEVNDNGKYSYSVLIFKSPAHDTVLLSNEGDTQRLNIAKGDEVYIPDPEIPLQYKEDTNWINNHEFMGWYDVKDVKHTQRVDLIKGAGGKTFELAAYWKTKVYDIYIEGESGVRATVSYDCTVALTEALCENGKPGYKLAGFSREGLSSDLKSPVATLGNCTYYGVLDEANRTITFEKRWEIANYTISYHLAGVEAIIDNQYKSYTIGSETFDLPVITGAELEFAGWYLDNDYSEDKKITRIEKGSTGDLHLYAKWVNPTFTIKFDDNISQYPNAKYAKSNKKMADISGKKTGELISLPAATYSIVSSNSGSSDTWVFQGWATSKAGDVKYTNKQTVSFKKTDINEDNEVILYAVYSSYVGVVYNLDGGNFVDSKNNIVVRNYDSLYYKGTKSITLDKPVKPGFDFLGWYDDDTGKKVTSVSSKNVGTYYLTAHWKERVYKLKIDPNGGKGKAVTISIPYSGYVDLTPYSNYTRAGYVLKGWHLKPDSDPEQQVYSSFKPRDIDAVNKYKSGTTFTIKAKWVLRDNEIAYYDEDASYLGEEHYKLSSKDYELQMTLPTKAGYTFAGWYYDQGTYKKPAGSFKDGKYMLKKGTSGDIKLYAKWSKSYKLVLHVDPSDYSKTEEFTGYKYETAKAIATPKFKQSGKIIAGWAISETDAQNNVKKYYAGEKILRNKENLNAENEIHLYAIWANKKYTIVYVDNSVDPAKEKRQVVSAGKTVTLQKNTFSRKGYGFLGWDTYYMTGEPAEYNDCAKVDFTLNSKMEDGEMKLYTVWVGTGNITFDKNDDGATITKTWLRYRCGHEVSEKVFAEISVPTNAGYVFGGWYTDKACKKAFKKISKTTVGNYTLYAKWTPASYTVTYDPNVPEGAKLTGKMQSQKRTYQKASALSKNAYKVTGYVFKGWGESQIEGARYSDGQKITDFSDGTYSKNRILYAQWEAVEYKITYKNMTGFENPNDVTYTTSEGLTLKEPERIGYTFKGWYTDKEFKKPITKIQPGKTGNITLYAKWRLD